MAVVRRRWRRDAGGGSILRKDCGKHGAPNGSRIRAFVALQRTFGAVAPLECREGSGDSGENDDAAFGFPHPDGGAGMFPDSERQRLDLTPGGGDIREILSLREEWRFAGVSDLE
jgi:hypothetical protein